MGCNNIIGDMSRADMNTPQGNTYEITIGEYDTIIVKVQHRNSINTETHFAPRGIQGIIKEKGKPTFKTDWSIRNK